MAGERYSLVLVTPKLILPHKKCLKNLATSIQEAQQDRKPDDHRPVMFLVPDEARFGRITRCSRCWAPAGIRPCVPQQIIRQYLSVFTAVAPQSGEMISLIFPTSNAEIMTIFLERVSQQFPDFFIVMQMVGAGWHRSHKVQVPENIRLLFQPPSPEYRNRTNRRVFWPTALHVLFAHRYQ